MSLAIQLILVFGLMFGGVFYNQATVWTAQGWRYYVAVAAGLGGFFVVPLVAVLLWGNERV